MHSMEDSLKTSLKPSENNMLAKLEGQKDYLLSKMHDMQLQVMVQTKTYQDTTQTALNKLEEHKKSLDMLTNSHRFDGSIDFYRNWTEYRNGFGNMFGEFWLGLEYVHQITKNRPHELLVEMKDFHGNYGYAKYDEFVIGSEYEKYELKKLGTYSGTAGDAMEYHKNQKFSTFDCDNDLAINNCAERWHGAWWYRNCQNSHLNGRYQKTTDDGSTSYWYDFKSDKRDGEDSHGATEDSLRLEKWFTKISYRNSTLPVPFVDSRDKRPYRSGGCIRGGFAPF
ncbi:AGAP012539-PA-like protein [Anopheles sinensis]|uniref:AGAP012539-PA-like protein n=1 Tax=Anopheles sinensis TaxID=74873 RepID=A0A084VT18_ANOSI|nr:AGAP012539-PA-like protein [Anopheles sinensis]